MKKDFARQVTSKIGAKCLKFTESLHLLLSVADMIQLTSKDKFLFILEMYDHGYESLVGSLRGPAEEEIQEIPGGWRRGRGGPGDESDQSGQRVRDRHGGNRSAGSGHEWKQVTCYTEIICMTAK